jgi:hypothetical protein
VHSITPAHSQTLLVYYIEERLNFSDRDIAAMYLLMGLLGVCIQGFVLKHVNDCLGERRVVILSYSLGVVTHLLYAFASRKSIVFLGASTSAFVDMAFPTMLAIKSNNAVSESLSCEKVAFEFVSHDTGLRANNRTYPNKVAYKAHFARLRHWHMPLVLLRCDLFRTIPKMMRWLEKDPCLSLLRECTRPLLFVHTCYRYVLRLWS